jgi:hypothetical protein
MNFAYLTSQLEHNALSIGQMIYGVTAEQARWRPGAASWSLLEVVNHLYDEERFDFRDRLDIILHRPEQAWPPINPQGWVTERHYNASDLQASLQNFLDERRRSLAWLRSLAAPDWETAAQAPWGKSMRAGDMLAAWAAHDLLHLRQLVELKWAYTTRQARPYQVRYAGEW